MPRCLMFPVRPASTDPDCGPLTVERVGDPVRLSAGQRDKVKASLLRFAMLLNEVGVGRVRQCRLGGCGRWFVASKRQEFCSTVHRNRAGYLAWKARQKRAGKRRR
jgi:predicted RNA-binding Zn ribbon-like protein